MKSLHERITKIYIAKVAIDFGIIKLTEWSGEFFFEWYTRLDNINKNEIEKWKLDKTPEVS